jgi:hypothetical protein
MLSSIIDSQFRGNTASESFLCYTRNMRDFVLSSALLICATVSAHGQACPKDSETWPSVASEVRTLEGQLVFHDGIRRWFELKLDQPQCGQVSIQLVRGERDWTPLEILRDRRVRSKGAIDFSLTGYYSLDTYQDVQEIQPVGTCERKSPFPDYSGAIPDKAIRAYRVDMHINYKSKNLPIVFRVSSSGKELQPWQAYASYYLTGGFVLYGHCGEGFVVEKVFGPPQASPGHFDVPKTPNDMAMFDAESEVESGVKDLHLGYTCVRKH